MTAAEEEFDLKTAFAELVQGDWSRFDHLLHEPVEPQVIADTKATIRCHYLASDPSGNPRVKPLARQLSKQILRFCTPRSRLNSIKSIDDELERDEAMTEAVLNARRLFTTKQENTGEGGELLLYILLERHLQVPQILSKLSLKTNTQVQVHGSDGIHAKLEEDHTLGLYWGESKIYKNYTSAFADCFNSSAPFLIGSADTQDLFLIKEYADLGDLNLRHAILDYFDEAHPKSQKLDVRAACLIGFSVDESPVLPADIEAARIAIQNDLTKWSANILGHIQKHGISNYQVEVFLIPLPNEIEFRDSIRSALSES